MFQKKKAKEKERRLLEELYTQYEQKMYAAAYSILGHVDQAEDAVQDAFIKLVRYLPLIEKAEETSISRLVMRVLKTTAIDQYRRNHRESEYTASVEYLEDRKTAVFPMQAVEDREYLISLLYRLPENSLEIIRLRCYYGFTARETAQILGITEDAVNKRLERARRQIQNNEGVEINERKQYQENIREFRRACPGKTV